MKLSQSFLSFIKGGIIGISSLIPSLSSGSVIYSLSVYNNFIEGISNVFKKHDKSLYLIVIPIMLGILGGLLGGINAINFFYGKYPNQTIFLFVGLLFGGLKLGYKNYKIRLKPKNIFIVLLIITFFIALYLVLSRYINISIPNSLFFKFILGLFIGITILIPGIPISSFTASLNEYFTSMMSSFTLSNIFSLCLFSIGVIIGIILISRMLYTLFKNHKTKITIIYLGLIIVSIIILILNIQGFELRFSNIFTCVLTFMWGYILAINLEKENDR